MKSLSKKLRARDNYLRRKYGIGFQDYEEMLAKQNFSCALCLRHQKNFKNRLAVEHNHKTKKVRALACFYCNKMRIGRHDLASSKALYEYMLKYDGENKVS